MMSLPPFHLAFPVHDLEAARAFYGGLLGWEPKVPLQQGLEATTAWFASAEGRPWNGVANTRRKRPARQREPLVVDMAAE